MEGESPQLGIGGIGSVGSVGGVGGVGGIETRHGCGDGNGGGIVNIHKI